MGAVLFVAGSQAGGGPAAEPSGGLTPLPETALFKKLQGNIGFLFPQVSASLRLAEEIFPGREAVVPQVSARKPQGVPLETNLATRWPKTYQNLSYM